MKKTSIYLIAILSICFFNKSSAQLALNNSLTPQQLVQNVLVGTGVQVTNVTFSGVTTAIASFSNGQSTNIGLNNGILLTSGSASNAIGPNVQGGISTSNNLPGDSDLDLLIPGYTTNDASVIEFDFTPLSDTLSFKYTFGSDEYNEYVNSNFNDVFGFFISGPNPAGGTYTSQNIAYLPNSTTPVSINNVNNGTANPSSGPCNNCAYFVDNTGGATIEYDAFTTVLTAWVLVTPCQQYHFKIAVADAGDHVLDSGVFLEENSFKTDAIVVETEYSVPGAGKQAIEGCNAAELSFTLPYTYLDTFWIVIDTTWGTATPGVDFGNIPDSLFVVPGQQNVSLMVDPIIDGILEGPEYITLVIPTSICTADTVTIPIIDYTPIAFTTSPDTLVCQGTAQLWVNPAYGSPPYIYDWTPPDSLSATNIANPTANPSATTSYIVAVSDSTGCPPVVDTITVTVSPHPSVSFIPMNTSGCEPLESSFQDLSAPNIASWDWDFGDGGTSTTTNPSHTYAAGTYTVTLEVTTVDGCVGSFSVPNLIVSHPTPIAGFNPMPSVTNIDNAVINFNDISLNPFTWDWNFGDPASTDNTSNVQNPSHAYGADGTYMVWLVVTSDKGCVDSVSHEVLIIVDEVEIPNVITPNNDSYNDYLHIKNADKLEQAILIIYNRWGTKVFEGSGYNNDNVKFDAEGLADGTYYYIFKYKTYFKEEEKSGTITVIRGN